MKIRTQRQRLLASTIILGAAATLSVAAPAFAQTAAQAGMAPSPAGPACGPNTSVPCAPGSNAPLADSAASNTPVSQATPAAALPTSTSSAAPSTQPTTVQEVVVTGSLFRRTNTETPSPVTVLSANEIAKQGIVTITDAVRSISADNSGTIPTAFANGFAAGAAGVSLRGLTAADTLVLIDGLRTADYPVADDGVRSFQDLNTIPITNIDRVEVLKDGASSEYGADAIAGVVNIITKQSYKGFEADASFGDSQHGGGQQLRANVIGGVGDLALDGWNAYVSAEYENDNKITVGQRGFPYNTSDLSSIGGLNNIGGQPGLNSGSIYGEVAPVRANGTVGLFRPLRACGVGTTPATEAGVGTYCAQNFATYSDDQPQEFRVGVDGRVTKQINGDTQAFVTVSYFENRVSANFAPSQIEQGVPTNTNGITLPAVLTNGQLNPNDPFAGAPSRGCPTGGCAAQIAYDFGDIPEEDTFDNHVVRGVAGLKGSAFGFNYEGDVTIARSTLNTTDRGFIDYGQLEADIADGAYSFINPASNSVGVLAALSSPLYKVSTNDMDSFDFHASRDIYQLPGGPLSFAFGGQARYEDNKDPELNPIGPNGIPEYLGLGFAETFGHRFIGAGFFELDAPVVKMLDINVSGRYDHYSDFGGTFNPKVGIKFTPFRQLVLRGTYSTGFRAPSFSQNGSSASEGFITEFASALPASFVAAHGNDAYVQSYSLALATISNPAVKPETSENYTLGFIYEPYRFINVSVDYYHIRQDGIIAQSDPSAVLNDYFNGTPIPAGASVTVDKPDPLFPNALPRPIVVGAPFVNANALTTSGLDVDLRANFRLPYDVHFTSELNATDIFGYEYTAGDTTVNYVGTQAPYILSSGAGTPKYKANWVNSFTYGKATITGTVNFTSGIKETGVDATGTSSITAGCLYPGLPSNCRVQDFWTADLTGSYQLTPHIELYLNILNLFDQNPPIDPADYAGTNYNPTYDQEGIVGRYFRVGAHVKF